MNEFDESFKDIENKSSNTKYYIMIFILYLIVIGLTIIVVLGIQARGKDIIDKSKNNGTEEKSLDVPKNNTPEEKAMSFVNSIENSLKAEGFNATKCSILSMKVICLNDTESKTIDVNANINVNKGYFDVVNNKATNGSIKIDDSTILITNGVYSLENSTSDSSNVPDSKEDTSLDNNKEATNDIKKETTNDNKEATNDNKETTNDDYSDLNDMRGLLQ